jgi:FkbM family methyltransferase
VFGARRCTDPAAAWAATVPVLRREGLAHLLGLLDAEAMAPFLAAHLRVYAADVDASAVVLDIGANVGGTTAVFANLFTPQPIFDAFAALPSFKWDATVAEAESNGGRASFILDARVELSRVRVLAFEPVPKTFAALVARSKYARWWAATCFQLAVGAPPSGRVVPVYARASYSADEQGSLGAAASLAGGNDGMTAADLESSNVTLMTVAALAVDLIVSSVFMMKIDVEGYDPHVLLGAKPLLRERRVQWVIFEYNHLKWREAAAAELAVDDEEWGGIPADGVAAGARVRRPLDSLAAVSAWLADLGYLCYYITSRMLLPVWGAYWTSDYEMQPLQHCVSNIICGLFAGDVAASDGDGTRAHTPGPALSALVQYYNNWAPLGTPPLHLPPCAI